MGMRADIGGLRDIGGEIHRAKMIEEHEGSHLTMADRGQHPGHLEPAKIATSVLQNMIQHLRRPPPLAWLRRVPRVDHSTISISDNEPRH